MVESEPDGRTPFQRDRDRILYAGAFARLAEITRVVSPEHGHVFHNRLTHSLKVGQIARRIAEKCIREQPEELDAIARQMLLEMRCIIGGSLPNQVDHKRLFTIGGQPL